MLYGPERSRLQAGDAFSIHVISINPWPGEGFSASMRMTYRRLYCSDVPETLKSLV